MSALGNLFREAANKYLWSGEGNSLSENKAIFSCDAVGLAQYWKTGKTDSNSRPFLFLRELGCDTSAMQLFSDFEQGRPRQGARYLWLHFAALVADEEKE